MFGLSTLRLGVYAALIVALGIVASLYHHAVHQDGYNEAKTIYLAREAVATTQAESAAETARLEAHARETALQTSIQTIEAQRYQEQQNALKTITQLRTGITAGTVRLSIPTTGRCTVSGAPGNQRPGTAPGIVGEERTELANQAAQDLVSLAADGDTAIRERNALIDHYNTVKVLCERNK